MLILAYYSVKDPVFQSAVLQYFKHYSNLFSSSFILVTFEHRKFPLSHTDVESIENELSRYNLQWYRLKWHSGNFKILKKFYDLIISLWTIRRLAKLYDIKSVYSEGFPGAIIGHIACRAFKLSHIIHSFEPHADYMLESAVWTKSSWEYRILKYYEKKVALGASWVLTATDGMASRLVSWGVAKKRIMKVPSCVDTDQFRADEKKRQLVREKLGFTKMEGVIVYLGKLGGMYWLEEFYETVSVFTTYSGCSFKFLILINENHDELKCQLDKRRVDPRSYAILSVDHSDVSAYLSAADIGLVAVRQKPSKQYCSPIKTGEYLSCGLPVIVPRGISDDYLELEKAGVGVLLENTTRQNLGSLPLTVENYLKSHSRNERARASRRYAIENRSLQTYRSIYLRIFEE